MPVPVQEFFSPLILHGPLSCLRHENQEHLAMMERRGAWFVDELVVLTILMHRHQAPGRTVSKGNAAHGAGACITACHSILEKGSSFKMQCEIHVIVYYSTI